MAETEGRSQAFEEMEQEIKTNIALQEAALPPLRTELAKLEAELPQTAQPATPKFDPAKHPLLRKTAEKQEPDKPVTFTPGDMVEAQWTDRGWYKAKVQSVLGSLAAPKYLVLFPEYGDSLTVDRNAVRPLPSKRKQPEVAAVPSPALPVTSTPHVISGPASVNPSAHAVRKNAADDDEEVKPKSRVPNKGQLNKRKSAWQDFQAKTSKKIPKKDSMFRTSTEHGSRGEYMFPFTTKRVD
jgi:survival-of-motor-neuron-related-splicing factor 30